MRNICDGAVKLPISPMGTAVRASRFVWLFSVMAALCFAGCGKPGGSGPPADAVIPTVDLAKLRQAFPSPGPDVQAGIQNVVFAVRYGKFDQAQTELQALAGDPSLTDTQKLVVAAAIDQAGKAQAAATAAAAAE